MIDLNLFPIKSWNVSKGRGFKDWVISLSDLSGPEVYRPFNLPR